MGNLFNALNGLKTNIFGGGNTGKTTPILRKTAIGINEESPISKLDHDPFAYSSIQYPRDLTANAGIGHYMLFYVNVQDKTKNNYEDSEGETVGNQVATKELVLVNDGYEVASGQTEAKYEYRETFVDGDGTDKFKYDLAAVRRGKQGSVLESDAVELSKSQRDRGSGMSSYRNTTKRITDSVAIYLPPNVQDTTTASYTGAATGVIGAAAAGMAGIAKNMSNSDYEAAAQGLVDSAKAMVGEAAIKAATELAEGLTGSEGTRGLINKAFGQADNPYMEVLFSQM